MGLAEKEQILNRLNRIEGQVRGIRRMIEDERYCLDVLTQIAAVRAAINKVGVEILRTHTQDCVLDAVNKGQADVAIQEMMSVLERFIK